MKKQLVICDCDERYRQMMQSYLIKRLKDFEILTFSSLKQAAEYSRQQSFAILLVGEHLYEKGLQEIQALQIFILREDGKKAITEYSYIEKYQSMENLIRDILKEYLDDRRPCSLVNRKKVRVHAFYSPVRKEAQTKAALALGQILTKVDKKVLYLNLQPFVGLEAMLQTSSVSDITDLLYFVGRQDNSLLYRLQSMKQSLGGVDYLAPAADYMDLLKISEQEWIMLLDMLTETSEYSEIILDLSEICQGLYRILERSDNIYSICGITDTEKSSMNQYKKLLKKRELSDLLEKTKWIELSQECLNRAVNMERLHATQLGEYMKGLMKENGNRQIYKMQTGDYRAIATAD